MFTELLPVLKDRTVILTIACLDNNILRVNVVPKRKSDKENDDAENALSTPLTVTATAEELDREFGQQVRTFSGSFEKAASNIRDIENAHAAAVKAAEDEKKNPKGKKVSVAQGKATARDDHDSPTPTNGRPVFGKPQTALAPTTQSLFDSPPPAEERSADDGLGGAKQETQQRQAESVSASPNAMTNIDRTDAVVQQRADTAAGSAPVEVTCEICRSPILPAQKRHSLMPFPAHASATECEAARATLSASRSA